MMIFTMFHHEPKAYCKLCKKTIEYQNDNDLWQHLEQYHSFERKPIPGPPTTTA